MPAAKFILSEQAVTDVDAVHAYIFADNPEAADRVEEAIFDGFELLARNPALGRNRQFRRHQNIRSWVVTEFPNYLGLASFGSKVGRERPPMMRWNLMAD